MKKMISTAFLSGVIALYCSPSAYAAPSKAFNHLMNEPITLWDFGLRKIESVLDKHELKDEEGFFSCSLRFEWDDDLLLISCRAFRYSFKNPKKFTKKETHEISTKVIDLVRLTLGYYYNEKSDSSYDEYRKSVESIKDFYPIEDYFAHETFVEANRPKDLGKQLENRIKITVQTGGKGLSYTVCESRLHKGQPMCMYSSHGQTAEAVSKMF